MADLLDGTSNTIMMVDVRDSGVNWAEPRDLDLSQPMPLPPGNHPGGNLAVYYDGHTYMISKSTPPEVVHALATRAGGEVIRDY